MSTATLNDTDLGEVMSQTAIESKPINRTWAIMRMQLVNKMTFIWTPLIIIAGSFALGLIVWSLIPEQVRAQASLGGAPLAVFWYLVPVGVMTMSYTFPFSQGMSVSRRSFYIGTVATFALFSAALSLFYFLMGLIEKASSGWGMDAKYFTMWMGDFPWYEGLGLMFGASVLLCMIGFAFATVYKRWGAFGLTLALVGLAIVAVAATALATWNNLWPQVGEWIMAQTPGSVALWTIAVAAVTAMASYGVLRRATP